MHPASTATRKQCAEGQALMGLPSGQLEPIAAPQCQCTDPWQPDTWPPHLQKPSMPAHCGCSLTRVLPQLCTCRYGCTLCKCTTPLPLHPLHALPLHNATAVAPLVLTTACLPLHCSPDSPPHLAPCLLTCLQIYNCHKSTPATSTCTSRPSASRTWPCGRSPLGCWYLAAVLTISAFLPPSAATACAWTAYVIPPVLNVLITPQETVPVTTPVPNRLNTLKKAVLL